MLAEAGCSVPETAEKFYFDLWQFLIEFKKSLQKFNQQVVR